MSASLIYKAIPTLALRGIAIFPHLRFHFEVARPKSVKAVDLAMMDDQRLFLVTQRDVNIQDPEITDLYKTGVVAHIKQITKDKDSGTYKVIVEAEERAVITKVLETEECFVCDVKQVRPYYGNTDMNLIDAASRRIKDRFAEYLGMTEAEPSEYTGKIFSLENPDELCNEVANVMLTKYEDRQLILDELNVLRRLETLNLLLSKELEVLQYEIDIEKRTEAQMDKNQKEYYLREKMRAISVELGEEEEPMEEIARYKEKIKALDCSDEVREKLSYEVSKLSKLQSNSADASVVRIYLDTALNIPFGAYTDDSYNLIEAREKLDSDHYGMKNVKERFIEMLAVKARTQNIKGQIICLVGPPGVGKTSIVRSVADTMGRKYTRLALGGVSDEAEIRGHRKTYIGSMPGRIISALTQAKSMNPIVLLDEIDKLGSSYKGDPSSALLEVLDPEQNNTFRDNYLEFPVDLSKVLFITTANDASAIPAPLYDRMEIIELPGYTPEEKLMIAKNHLVKKQMKMHEVNGNNVRFSDKSLRFIIDGYTREAGVRRLEQVIASIIRKCVVKLESEDCKRISITNELIKEMLGPEKYVPETVEKEDLVGVVNGLAYSTVGGCITQIEVAVMPGTGKLELTGSLGDVMKESAKTAVSYVRSIGEKYGIDNKVWSEKDIHIHAPEGAVPKDGPSAGVTMATAVLSALGNFKVDRFVTMTGEISLTGRVMRIGGLREKSMAAYKSGAKKVIIPKDNMPDLWEIDDKVRESLEFIPVTKAQEVFSAALKCDKTFDISGKTTVNFTRRSSVQSSVQNGKGKRNEV